MFIVSALCGFYVLELEGPTLSGIVVSYEAVLHFKSKCYFPKQNKTSWKHTVQYSSALIYPWGNSLGCSKCKWSIKNPKHISNIIQDITNYAHTKYTPEHMHVHMHTCYHLCTLTNVYIHSHKVLRPTLLKCVSANQTDVREVQTLTAVCYLTQTLKKQKQKKMC